MAKLAARDCQHRGRIDDVGANQIDELGKCICGDCNCPCARSGSCSWPCRWKSLRGLRIDADDAEGPAFAARPRPLQSLRGPRRDSSLRRPVCAWAQSLDFAVKLFVFARSCAGPFEGRLASTLPHRRAIHNQCRRLIRELLR